MAELVDQVPEAAQRMWTSALQLRGKEFCFILNDTVRDDDEELADPMAVRLFARPTYSLLTADCPSVAWRRG